MSLNYLLNDGKTLILEKKNYDMLGTAASLYHLFISYSVPMPSMRFNRSVLAEFDFAQNSIARREG